MIRVLVVDDQALIRGALAAMLDLEPDIEVVGQAGVCVDLVEVARACRTDVAVLDIRMPGVSGLDAVPQLRAAVPSCRILMCTAFGRPGYVRRALAAGAVGFILKDAPPEQLVDAVRKAHQGLRSVDPALAAEAVIAGSNPLTERECEVLRSLQNLGATVDVAWELHLSVGTVRNHLSSAIRKTGARTRAEAAQIADQRGWL